MKKLIIAAIAFTTVSYASAQTETTTAAQTATATETAVIADVENKQTPVKLEELPDAVKKTLASDTYAGWKATSATWVEGKGISYYEVQLMRGEEKNVAKLSKDGKPIV